MLTLAGKPVFKIKQRKQRKRERLPSTTLRINRTQVAEASKKVRLKLVTPGHWSYCYAQRILGNKFVEHHRLLGGDKPDIAEMLEVDWLVVDSGSSVHVCKDRSKMIKSKTVQHQSERNSGRSSHRVHRSWRLANGTSK